jgi:stage II sporulation protein AA (anti-sigma F factor antagonist)
MNITEMDNILMVQLEGELDHHNTSKIRVEIDEAIREIRPYKVVLDFTSVTFMDSSGIGLVIGRFKVMQEFSGIVEVIGASKHIAKVMNLSGIDRIAAVNPKENE